MNGGEQYSLDMALLKIREEKRKRKMRTEHGKVIGIRNSLPIFIIRLRQRWIACQKRFLCKLIDSVCAGVNNGCAVFVERII